MEKTVWEITHEKYPLEKLPACKGKCYKIK